MEECGVTRSQGDEGRGGTVTGKHVAGTGSP